MVTRRVWQTHKAGAISSLSLIEQPLGVLPDNKLRVSVRAVGLNFADIFALTGLYSATPSGAFIPGLEFSGVIESVGSEISNRNDALKPGDRVMGVIRFGGYATSIDIEPAYCFKLPDDWSFEAGAAFPVQTLTAWYALRHLGSVNKGDKVLVQSAAGGVGLQAMALCQKLEAKPIGVVGSEQKRVFLKNMGYTDILVRDETFESQLDNELAGTGLNLILDGVGGQVQKACFNRLAPMGRLIVFGAAEFTPGKNRPNYLKALWHYLTRPKYDVLAMISDNRSVMAFNLIWLWSEVERMGQLVKELDGLSLPEPHIGRSFSFDDALLAIEHLRSGESVGKVILRVE